MMISSSIFVFVVFFILNANADLIAWNRLRNNAAKHHCKRIANFSKTELMTQYQHFFAKNGQSYDKDDPLRRSPRRLIWTLQHQKQIS